MFLKRKQLFIKKYVFGYITCFFNLMYAPFPIPWVGLGWLPEMKNISMMLASVVLAKLKYHSIVISISKPVQFQTV